jgi:hypothetical protein
MKRDSGALLAMGAIAALSALSRIKGSRSKIVRTDLAGSHWSDERSARQAITALARSMEPDAKDLAYQYAEISPSWLTGFFREWEALYETGCKPRWGWKSEMKLDGPPPMSAEAVADQIEQGYIDQVIEAMPEWSLHRFNQYAEPLAINWGEMPPAASFGPPTILRDVWLIHHSSSPSIDRQGFRLGVQRMDGLAYTGGGRTFQGQGPGYNFAYLPEDHEHQGFDNWGRPKYGDTIYAFHVPWAVKAEHYGDEETQVIFWGPSARRIVEIKQEELETPDGYEDRWIVPVLDDNRDGRTVATETSEELVDWLRRHWQQYRGTLDIGADRRRRRVERGWSREKTGTMTTEDYYGNPMEVDVYEDVYRGPRRGSPSQKSLFSRASRLKVEQQLPVEGAARALAYRLSQRPISEPIQLLMRSEVESVPQLQAVGYVDVLGYKPLDGAEWDIAVVVPRPQLKQAFERVERARQQYEREVLQTKLFK